MPSASNDAAIACARNKLPRLKPVRRSRSAASQASATPSADQSPNRDYRNSRTSRVRAERAGPLHERAWHLHEAILWCSEILRKDRRPAAALPQEAMTILERAAAGKPVDELLLGRVLEAAAQLDQRLTFEVLARFPRPA